MARPKGLQHLGRLQRLGDVGNKVLWVLRDCLCGEVLLARSLLSSTEADLAALITEVKKGLSVPIAGVIMTNDPLTVKCVADI